MTQYFCCTLRRRVAVKEAGLVNGIEYLEVRDTEEPDPTLRQRTLFVRLLNPPLGLSAGNVLIDGGERIKAVPVEWAAPGDGLPLTPAEAAELMEGIEEPQNVLVVRTSIRGDRSPYRFRLVAGPGLTAPPAGFDPQLVEVSFSFAVECPSDFDCLQPCACHPRSAAEVDIDYLVKDYQGLRRVMLERMSLLSPGWVERNPADVGVALVELLAYVADGLSYRQDAIATEAYIGTSRSRISVRRHARLVDYPVHDGCNARAWVQVIVTSPVLLPAGTPLLTRVPSLPGRIEPGSDDERTAAVARPTVFETMADAELDPRLQALSFWTWGEESCCLPEGAVSATLLGHYDALEPGMVLVLAETLSPTLLSATEVDSGKRWAVRLTEVVATQDPSGGLFTPAGAGAVDVTEIGWAQEDSLPFSICLSAGDDDTATATALAWGNIVLADHGRTIPREELGQVPAPPLVYATTTGGACEEPVPTSVRPRFRPVLAQRPLTWSAPVKNFAPASVAMLQDARTALPSLRLTTEPATTGWSLRRDLLNSDAGDRHAVIETEYDGTAQLRFGDGEHGAEPTRDVMFVAAYRVGNGSEGNVGAESISHVVVGIDGVAGCRNPMPATGGTDAETGDQIRRDAPHAFARQERAVTAADYAEVARRTGTVQQAAATFRWTGSWRTVFLTADRPGARRVDEDFRLELRSALERYRMAGYDLEVDEPRYVPIELELTVCVRRDHFRPDVEQAVQQVLGSGQQPDGRPGLFNPDLFTFGQPVYLSSVYAAVHAVPGVDSVAITTFRRQHEPNVDGLDTGLLPMGRLEIGQLDNNPNFPDRGLLRVTTGGGA